MPKARVLGDESSLAPLAEAYRRGILPEPQKKAFEEAVKRQLIPKKYVDTSFSQELNTLQGRAPDVDYKPGAGFEAETALKKADNPEEAKLALEKIFGQGSAGQDKSGRWWVLKDGKKVSVFGEQSSIAKRIGTSVAADAPEMAGMTIGEQVGAGIGAAVGIESGPGATLTALVGAGVGGGIAKGLDDAWKWLHGTQAKTPKEEARAIGTEAAFSAGGALAGRGLSALGRFALKPKLSPIVHVTPEMETRTSEALARGMVPTIAQATGGKTYRLFAADQSLQHYIWGDPAAKKNVEALNKELEKKLAASGVAPDKMADVMRAVVRKDIPLTDINHEIVNAVTSYREGLESLVTANEKKATDAFASDLDRIDKSVANPGVQLSEKVAEDITQARQSFATQAGGFYQTVDELAGGRELVDTSPIKNEVKAIVAELPKTKDGKILGSQVENKVLSYIHDVAALKDKITLSDAQKIRSHLLDLTADPSLKADIGWHNLSRISQAVDVSIDAVGLSEADKPVVDSLRAANAFYRENIGKFKDILANKLVKEAGQGGVEPEKVMDAIVRPGRVEQAQRIMRLLQPQTKEQLSRDYFHSILGRASSLTEVGKIDGKRLLQIVSAEGPMIKTVIGEEQFARLSELAKNVAAFDGKVPLSQLGSDSTAGAVKALKAAQDTKDAFLDRNYLKALADPKVGMKDDAFDYITRPGHTDRIKTALDFFGRNSHTAAAIKQKLMAKILASSVGLSDDPAQQVFGGSALKKTLTDYGREQLTEVYGKEMTDDLFKLSDTIQTISSAPKGSRMAIGLVAGAHIMLAPLTHLSSLVWTALGARLMATPGFMHWLILGYEGNSLAIRTVNQIVRQSVNLATQEAIPSTTETPSPQGRTVH